MVFRVDNLVVKSKIWFEKSGKPVFGEGRYRILKAVETGGSISAAARALGMSFRDVWYNVDRAEKNLGVRLLVRTRGGRGGGRSHLTSDGRFLVGEYERVLRERTKSLNRVIQE